MKSTLTKVMISLQALAALLVIGAVKIWAPVCGKMLLLESGKEVPMKCYYTGQAAIVLAAVLLTVAIMALLAKQDYRKFAVVSLVIGVLLFMVFTNIIGVCANIEMRCNTTALWGKLCAAVTAIASFAMLIGGKDGQLPD